MNKPHLPFCKELANLTDNARGSKFSGFDPYDGLNSKFLKRSFLYRIPLIRLAWIQCFKRCPINLRRILLVPKGFNSKAGALFISGLIKQHRLTKVEAFEKDSQELFNHLKQNAIKRDHGIGWGYNFDWQAKAFFLLEGTPNIVTSVYVGNALLDYYKEFGDDEAKELALGVSQFILTEMLIWESKEELCFSYAPRKDVEIHNANLMAAAFLSRINKFTRDEELSRKIEKSVNFSLKDIREDGYWPYGTELHHRWMDNFHTAFNLEALLSIRENLRTDKYDHFVKKVFRFYVDNMFLEDGTPKYYHNRCFPIDTHTIAESIIIFSKVIGYEGGIFSEEEKRRAKQLADCIVDFAFSNMWNQKGYFYYQKNRWYTNKISYMRWSQAWMFYALSCYQEQIG